MTVPNASSTNGVHKQPQPSSRLDQWMKLDVWSIFTPTAMPPDAINLGQGFMNWAPPEFLQKAADEAMGRVDAHHYSHPRGRMRLRSAISEHYSADFSEALGGRKLNPETEILVTAGANEGMYSIWAAFLEKDDEVILFEPFFDQYIPSITFNGGKPVYVPLHPASHAGSASANEWKLDLNELRAAITPKTKQIVVNTPHNPIGKVFTRAELEGIAQIAREHNLLLVADEVYDCLTFDGKQHERIANLPGMWDRTITVCSAGKSFACTGWRVGWLLGPTHLITPSLVATTRIVFCTNSPLQEAVAAGLEQAVSLNFFDEQVARYAEQRKVLTDAFDEIGIPYWVPHGSYFILTDISNIQVPEDYPYPDQIRGRGRDFHVLWWMSQELKVVAIPPSEFYSEEHRAQGENFARFAFCKDVDTLKEAGRRLQGLKKYLKV